MMPHQQQDLRNGDQQQIGNFEATTTPDDYYLEQMLSSLPSWNDFTTHNKSAWDMKQQQAVQFDEESATAMHQMHANNSGLERSIQGLYNGFAESLQSQQLLPSQKEVDPSSAQGNNGSAPRQRVRARRGQATDPHSIAERLRRERIAERMKGLQELVPNANKTDKASMLDEIIDYVKFLQLQVKVLSVSRMGGAAAAAVAPDHVVEAERGNAIGIGIGSGATSVDEEASLTMTEQQVAKLMEEDMGSAMQYLQGKGLCLMPISLATAISTATSKSHSHSLPHNNKNTGNVNGMFSSNGNGPTSPAASVLTVQSAAFVNDYTSALG